ncbi:hypothetical protein [Paenibacillus sp. 1A_MP2]|uniref:hypothetical protein n=1 Tax=Paenibacillus sp. 1A_MP2 TaxID=3457495 RepID=UPI003FCDC47E
MIAHLTNMHDLEKDHANKIQRLLLLNSEDIASTKLNSLIKAVRSSELTVSDILRYTTITEKQLNTLLENDKA